jgi:hypothetical protein
MKLENGKLKMSVLIITTLIVSLMAYTYLANTSQKSFASVTASHELALVPPAFAADLTAEASFLNQEAGMAIWLNATAFGPFSQAQMNAAKSVIKLPENETSEYIIGSIPLATVGFGSNDYPHCFIHVSGWVVIYWLKVNPANPPSTAGWLGKTFPLFHDSNHDWYDINTHLLSDNLLHYSMTLVCGQLGISASSAQYYHFQYPAATKLEIAIKSVGDGGTDTFNLKIPGTSIIDEQSFSVYFNDPGYGGGTFKIDTTQIASGYGRFYGDISSDPNLLSPDIWHTVTITAARSGLGRTFTNAAIILLYH